MENNSQHEKFMRIAIQLSTKNVSEGLGGPFGAVVVKDGEIIGESANTVHQTIDPTAHAEIAAIRLACTNLKTIDLTGATIYTSCEPCPMCLGAIYWSGIDTIYYGNTKQDAAAIDFDDEFIYQEIEKPLESRKLPIKQLLRNEAQQAFKLWQKSPLKEE
ncbi:nucleoside deaminase [Pedobacter cryotolerans]|uniref:Nucleoside deaminase n=1 Tax=Pedobacter cryotolerans TaxID=2571270 RepID=A0A4U1C4T7_9SPHI|nr:nucleoside deaminase [Pedobacter cryotolerans]TKB99417.1 nucleoside deaminase [Pedobacter cryotolerans]